jgi:uncharacterized protein (TIGR04255 family)
MGDGFVSSDSALRRERRPTYDRPPLVEAVFELFASQAAEESRIESVREEMASLYGGQADEINPDAMAVELGPQGAGVRFRRDPARYRYRTPDGTRLVQVASNMAAFNIFPPYSHYEEFLPEMEGFFGRWLEAIEPASLSQIGQRYINKVRLPLDASPADFFAAYPTIPPHLGHPPFAMQIQFAELSSGAVLVNLGLQTSEEGRAVYLLDIYARSSPEIPIEAEWDAIQSWFDESHEAIGDAFEGLLTRKTRELFGERTEA